MNLFNLIQEYLKGNEIMDLHQQLDYYENLNHLEIAIDNACFGRFVINGKTFFSDHFIFAFAACEKPKKWFVSDLYHARDVLFIHKKDIQNCTNFHSIYELLEIKIRPLQGIGDLLHYDISLRVGAYLKKYPNKVYAQRGALYGASGLFNKKIKEKIIFDYKNDFIQHFKEFIPLNAHEAENFLCVYENELQKLYK